MQGSFNYSVQYTDRHKPEDGEGLALAKIKTEMVF